MAAKPSPMIPDFSRGDGLLPAIAQDAETGEVLMLAYIGAESFAETLATGRVVYYSRSRKQLWRGERPCATCAFHSRGLRRRHDLAESQASRSGLPRRLPKLLFPPNQRRRSTRRCNAAGRSGCGLWLGGGRTPARFEGIGAKPRPTSDGSLGRRLGGLRNRMSDTRNPDWFIIAA